MTLCFLGLIFLLPSSASYLNGRLGTTLSGVTNASSDPVFSIERLMDGSYQSDLDSYVTATLPGRDLMVRVRNQIIFSVFDKSPNDNIIIGKNKNLFEEEYISKYEKVYPPADSEYISSLIEDLLYIRDKLEERGKEFYIFITPTKVRYYEEDVPEIFIRSSNFSDMTGNYEIFTEALETTDLKVYDSIAYIDTIKDDFPYPLYHKTGTHWSWPLATAVVLDLAAWLNEESRYDLTSGSMEVTEAEGPVYPDSDIYDSLNVFSAPYDTPYYSVSYQGAELSGERPNLFCRGGSFMGQSLTTLINSGYFNEYTYVENTNIFYDTLSAAKTFSDYSELDIKKELDKADIVIFEVNESHIPTMGFGIVEYITEHPEIFD